MPTVRLSDGATLFYREDSFADPWQEADTVVLLHGFCRNSNFWYAWVPALARHFRVVRWDARGCGNSPVPPLGFRWSLRQYHQDLAEFLDGIGCQRANFIGESMGGMVLPYFALWYPERMKSFVACSSNLGLKGPTAREMAAGAASMIDALAQAQNLEAYIRATERSRLHSEEVLTEARSWYAREWAKTPKRIWEEWAAQLVPQIDLTAELLGQVHHPALIIAPSRCVKLPLEETQFWVDHIPTVRLAMIDAASQGLAFARADECARVAVRFLLALNERAAEE